MAKALQDYSAALAINAHDAETLKLRAEALQALGEHEEARADISHAAESERIEKAYQSYLDIAKAVYHKGITKTWTIADVDTKPNVPLAILLGLLAFIGAYIGFALLNEARGDSLVLCWAVGPSSPRVM